MDATPDKYAGRNDSFTISPTWKEKLLMLLLEQQLRTVCNDSRKCMDIAQILYFMESLFYRFLARLACYYGSSSLQGARCS